MKIQRSLTHSQNQNGVQQGQFQQDNISSRTSMASQSSQFFQNSQIPNPLLDKQLKEVNKQRELLAKLQREKEEIERQMKNNEKAIQNRMQKLHQERVQMEVKIVKAAVVIQRFARGFITRLNYKQLQEKQIQDEKDKLNNVLAELNTQIKTCFNQVDDQIDVAASKIQRAARKMLARKSFRINLYKLMLFKNIVENKVHKEKMQMLYAFEQLIINTEDEGDQDYYDEVYGAEDDYGEEMMPYGAGSGFSRIRQLGPNGQMMQRVPNEADYLSNPSDIIDEEECEESEEDDKESEKEDVPIQQQQQVQLPQISKNIAQGLQKIEERKLSSQQSAKPGSSHTQGGRVLAKVTQNDLLEFAVGKGTTTAAGRTIHTEEPFEIEIVKGGGIFSNKNSALGDTAGSVTVAKYRSNSEKRNQNQDNLIEGENSGVVVALPKGLSQPRRIQPRQQQSQKPKVLPLPLPEPPKPQVQRPLDMDRIIALSKPKEVPDEEPLPPLPKKKANKPPVAGQKKKKKKQQLLMLMPAENSDSSSTNTQVNEAVKTKKPKSKRRSSRQGSYSQGGATGGNILGNYERLLRHRESRRSLHSDQDQQKQQQSTRNARDNQQRTNQLPQNKNLYAIEYKQNNECSAASDNSNDFNSRAGVKLPIALAQKQPPRSAQVKPNRGQMNDQRLGSNFQAQPMIGQTSESQNNFNPSNNDLSEVESRSNFDSQTQLPFIQNHKIPQVQPRQDLNDSHEFDKDHFKNLQYAKPQIEQIPQQIDKPNFNQNYLQKSFSQQPPQEPYIGLNAQTGVGQQEQIQPSSSQDPSLLYKKCFPNSSSMSFKERFPVFSDILQRYNKNLKNINPPSTQQNQAPSQKK